MCCNNPRKTKLTHLHTYSLNASQSSDRRDSENRHKVVTDVAESVGAGTWNTQLKGITLQGAKLNTTEAVASPEAAMEQLPLSDQAKQTYP